VQRVTRYLAITQGKNDGHSKPTIGGLWTKNKKCRYRQPKYFSEDDDWWVQRGGGKNLDVIAARELLSSVNTRGLTEKNHHYIPARGFLGMPDRENVPVTISSERSLSDDLSISYRRQPCCANRIHDSCVLSGGKGAKPFDENGIDSDT